MSYEDAVREVDKRQTKFIERLREAVEIPSVSAEAARRNEVFRMVDWTQKQMEALNIKCHQVENGMQTFPDGSAIKLPPVIFGQLGENKQKKTLLVYGHLDVQPADLSDGWNTEPFQLVEKDGKMFGRGSTDDKGPVIAWLNAIEVMQSLGIEIPVNIKFVFEGMEESGSEGLEQVLQAHKSTFLADIDWTCISDNYWVGKKKPCITYGLRGICYYGVEISGTKQDLHSGSFGGTVHEPMIDLCWILGQLTDVNGKILIEGLNDSVAPLSDEEKELYKTIDFNANAYKNELGAEKLTSECPQQLLMNRWRYPALSVHGIEGAFYGPGAKTVIPAKVIGKFSIRIVPNMEPSEVHTLVTNHLNKLWSQRGSPNKFKVNAHQGAKAWVADFKHPHYQAATRALKKVHGIDPDFTREGGSIPITLTFQDITEKNVMLLPIGACDDMAHSQNEKLDVSNYMNGIKAFVAYLLELGQL
ncbi:peptidase family m20/M25/M40 domain-containing protein [Ditylenchus destructor]|uniref:Peptidase family m20/M25/M40 domain-containing protein n=1 Tax=Ditylenchus destructor TaxID=166010 RepID=A0AAD4NMS2_9BILA|nr:peptidase family m20/M25/M40 domain-containing protein [Ditylenchus destructor]